ncbi:hypothetical protein B0H12DRAFT_329393 [Mycena haematopus]|nr:hypothetical protein B0H12DRAFT_329393 [Mycena haematopus]
MSKKTRRPLGGTTNGAGKRTLFSCDADPDQQGRDVTHTCASGRRFTAANTISTSHHHHHPHHAHIQLATSKLHRSTSKGCTAARAKDAGEGESDDDGGALDASHWPTLFHAAFYAQVWRTYRAGFQPIRSEDRRGARPPGTTRRVRGPRAAQSALRRH